MKVLLLAPQPFYSERGTPIAILNLVSVLGNLGYSIDLLTFPRGQDLTLQNTRILRTGKWLPFTKSLPVGFSFRKIALDSIMLLRALFLCRKQKYDVIHAVEESVFIALLCSKLFGGKVIYDMDSSMSDQLIERYPRLSFVHKLLDRAEAFAVRHSDRVLAVCQALADKSASYGATTPIEIIEDIADNQSPQQAQEPEIIDDLSSMMMHRPIKCLYVGNLEHYQGIGLVLDALAHANAPQTVGFIVIGGQEADIQKYQAQACENGIEDRVIFLGPRPVKNLKAYLQQADILISPRLKGVNTPMKIYTYLGAGKPIVATEITSHTQVLTQDTACLVPPNPSAVATGLAQIIADKPYAERLATAAKRDASERFSYKRFSERIGVLYQSI